MELYLYYYCSPSLHVCSDPCLGRGSMASSCLFFCLWVALEFSSCLFFRRLMSYAPVGAAVSQISGDSVLGVTELSTDVRGSLSKSSRKLAAMQHRNRVCTRVPFFEKKCPPLVFDVERSVSHRRPSSLCVHRYLFACFSSAFAGILLRRESHFQGSSGNASHLYDS